MSIKITIDSDDWYSPADFIKNAEKTCRLILYANRLQDIYDVEIKLIEKVKDDE